MAKTREVVKKVENAVLYSDGSIKLMNVRVSYPHVFEAFAPKDKPDQVKKYSIVCLLEKKTHKEAKNLLKEVKDSLLNQNNKGAPLKGDKIFLRDGDEVGADASFAGCWTVNASELKRPGVRGPVGKADVWTKERDDDKIYGGCYCTLVIRPWWMDNKWGKRVNCGLVLVQFLRDGEPFGSRTTADDAAEDLDEAEGSDVGGFDEDSDI